MNAYVNMQDLRVVCGHPPRIFFETGGSEITSETILAID